MVLAPYLCKLRLQRLFLAVQFRIRCLRLSQFPAQQRPAAVLRRQQKAVGIIRRRAVVQGCQHGIGIRLLKPSPGRGGIGLKRLARPEQCLALSAECTLTAQCPGLFTADGLYLTPARQGGGFRILHSGRCGGIAVRRRTFRLLRQLPH